MSSSSKRDETSPLQTSSSPAGSTPGPTQPEVSSRDPNGDSTRWIESKGETNWLDSATEYVNDHIRAFRAIPWIVGGAGLLLLLRNTSVLTRFRSVSEIPAKLFKDNDKISGVVATTTWDSVGVWHVPAIRRILRWGLLPSSSSSEELLKVSFAGVAVGNAEGTENWLQQNLLKKRVDLTLLSRSGDTAQCVVHTKGFRRKCVNEQLLACGLAAQTEVTGFKQNQDWVSFVTLLGRVEGVAKRKGAGLWRGSEHETLWWKFRNTIKKS